MTCTSTMAASALAVALACCRQTSAFVAPGTGTGTAGLRTNAHMQHRLHRIEEPGLGRRRRSVPRLSMLKGDSGTCGSEVGRNSDDASGSSSGASTRLEFGAGLGAAAAAIVLGGTTAGPRPALAEDTSTAVAGDAAAAGVAEAAQEAAPVEVAAPAAPVAETRPLRDLGFEVPYTGKSVPLSKFLGSRATLVVNPKIDDPESLHQVCWCVFCVCARGCWQG